MKCLGFVMNDRCMCTRSRNCISDALLIANVILTIWCMFSYSALIKEENCSNSKENTENNIVLNGHSSKSEGL